MKVIAADSSAAILDDRFDPLFIVAAASVLVEPPYKEASMSLPEPIFVPAEKGQEVIVHEAELCRDLIAKAKADVVHLDMSLGSIPLEQLSPIEFSTMRISANAKRNLIKILPKLRRIASEITQKHGVDVLAIGKESIPVRIAELISGANAILYTCGKAMKDKKTMLLGLPSKCQPRQTDSGICLHSLITAEFDIRGCAEDSQGVLKEVNVVEMLNPCARGFRTLKIEPKTQT